MLPPRRNAYVVLSGALEGEAPERVHDVQLDCRAEADATGKHDLVDPAAADRAGERADEPVPRLAVRLLVDDGERGEHRSRDDAGWAGLDLAGAALECRPSAVDPGGCRVVRAADDRRGDGRPVRGACVHELGQDEGGWPERRPCVVLVGSPAREPEPAHEHWARTGDARGPHELAPVALGVDETPGTLGLGRP